MFRMQCVGGDGICVEHFIMFTNRLHIKIDATWETMLSYPTGEKQINSASNLYMRNKRPIIPSAGISQVTHNIDSINYQKYNAPTTDEPNFSLSGATSTQKQQMDQLQTRLTQLS